MDFKTIEEITMFYNIGTLITNSYNYYFSTPYSIAITSLEVSHNKIMNYFWGICTANREEIIERMTYDSTKKNDR